MVLSLLRITAFANTTTNQPAYTPDPISSLPYDTRRLRSSY